MSSVRRRTGADPSALGAALLAWYGTCGRDLPWRRNRTPYRVWVSEMMLQQTQVDTVVPYFQRWMRQFPSWHALARANLDDALKCWEGLGYYARARNLHAAARHITTTYGGRVDRAWRGPTAVKTDPLAALATFPGVGPYSAAAIASLAFGVEAAVVDGNVIRVLCRVLAYAGDPRSRTGNALMTRCAHEVLLPGQAAACNEAIMDLGAMVCRPRKPRCEACPWASHCRGAATGAPERYPRRRRKRRVPHRDVTAAVIVDRRGRILIAQRRADDMLGGLWEFPGGKVEPGETVPQCLARELHEELGIRAEVGPFFMVVRHTYSHFRMTLHVHWARIADGRPRAIECAATRWVTPAQFADIAFSRADLHVVDAIRTKKVNLERLFC